MRSRAENPKYKTSVDKDPDNDTITITETRRTIFGNTRVRKATFLAGEKGIENLEADRRFTNSSLGVAITLETAVISVLAGESWYSLLIPTLVNPAATLGVAITLSAVGLCVVGLSIAHVVETNAAARRDAATLRRVLRNQQQT